MNEERVAAVLRDHGWTCEYHEPVNGPGECSQCDDAHRRTAIAMVEAVGYADGLAVAEGKLAAIRERLDDDNALDLGADILAILDGTPGEKP